MFSKTMSHLFLAVVAAAAFLVSGCGAPIGAPDSGEQVRAVEAERIQKLESDVAEAVKAADPDQTLAFLGGSDEFKKLEPEDQKEAMDKLKDRMWTLLEGKELKDRMLDAICKYEATIAFGQSAERELLNNKDIANYFHLEGHLVLKMPNGNFVKMQDNKLAKMRNNKYHGKLSYTAYRDLIKLLESERTANLQGADADKGCGLAGKAQVSYLHVAGALEIIAYRAIEFALSFHLEIPNDAEAWLLIPETHWLKVALIGNMREMEDKMGKLIETRKTRKLTREETEELGILTRNVRKNAQFMETWPGSQRPSSPIRPSGTKRGIWREKKDGVWSSSTAGVVIKPLLELKKAVTKGRGPQQEVYLMVAQKEDVEVLGKKKTIRLVYYEAYEVDAPTESGISLTNRRKIPVEAAPEGKVACFPKSIDGQNYESIRDQFEETLKKHGKPWRDGCEDV